MSSIGFWGVFLSRIGLDPNLPIDGRMVDWKVGERVRVTEGIDEGRIFIVTSGRMTHDDLPHPYGYVREGYFEDDPSREPWAKAESILWLAPELVSENEGETNE